MSPKTEQIQRELEQALNTLAQTQGDDLVRQIRPILLANLDRGRIEHATDEKPDRIHEYVWRLAQTFVTLNPYLHQLQIERSHIVWEPLFERMQTWAYNFLLRKGFVHDDHTREIAIECATEAAITLLNTHFPYDTEFDPWAHILLQNTCRKYMQKAFRKSVVPEEKMTELEEDLLNVTEPPLEISLFQDDGVQELLKALEQLSEARRTVIQLIYFDDRKPEEVAHQMHKSVNAVYGLQFHALHDLRKILGTIRDTINE